MESMLSLVNLNKSFGKRQIIHDLSMDIYAGEVFGFLGPNGAGKTTTIKMVMGFIFADSGRIIINGTDMNKNYEKAMANLGGIVENPEVYKDLSGIVNLQMYARLHGNIPDSRIEEVIELVGMKNRINDKVKKYSLGMKQRLGLAQALLHRPRVLILDEPTNGLDPAGIMELREILKHLAHSENTAVMVSSHQLSEMQNMCDRVGIINNGRLIDVQLIGSLLSSAAGTAAHVRLTVDNPAAAEALLRQKELPALSCGPDFIELQANSEDTADINSLLVSNGIKVYEINREKTSLESVYMEITKGGGSIA